jgi:uncharacterized protein YbbK (DUF523 family)
MIAVRVRPLVGISACLVGERVRYDGGDKLDPWLAGVLGADVEWVRVCPEVEAGFGTPREPMDLVRDPQHGVVLVTSRVRLDLTAVLRSFAERRVEELASLELDGYVLKAGSPSCAISRAIGVRTACDERAATDRSEPASGAGPSGADRAPGLFAEALMRRLPDLPVTDERRLAEADARRRFVEQVFARYRAAKVAG